MTDSPIVKSKLCLLCDGTQPHTWNQMHVTNGYTWKPEKGHPKYDLHVRMVKLLNL